MVWWSESSRSHTRRLIGTGRRCNDSSSPPWSFREAVISCHVESSFECASAPRCTSLVGKDGPGATYEFLAEA